MFRCLTLATLVALVLIVTGCGSRSTEIKPKGKSDAPPPTSQDSMKKAMQSMPPEMQKKMESQMQKMKR